MTPKKKKTQKTNPPAPIDKKIEEKIPNGKTIKRISYNIDELPKR